MIIGIDLGTTNSLAAVFRDGEAVMIPNRLGEYLTPSVVSIDDEGTVLVGKTAKEYAYLHPLRSASVFKRSMGTSKVYNLGNHKFSPEELSSLVLRSLKEDAEAFLGCEVDEAIVSVPAYFNDFQRKATKEAGELAGLKVSRIINEPTAAAIAHGIGSSPDQEKCLVFDLGGGTFDVSILEFYDNVMEVHAVAGDNFLGGEDFTQALAVDFLEKSAVAPETLDYKTMNDVLKAAETAKCSFAEKNEVTLSCTVDGSVVSRKYTLSEYEELCQPLLERLRKPIERSIRDAGVRIEDIDRIILVGGATRLPIVKNFVVKLFKRFPGALVDPDMAVAQGAALQCGMKERNEEIREVVLTDVCPFTLGTEVTVYNGLFDESGHYLPIIERNTVIPVSRRQTLYTVHDNQTRVDVKILQGESRIAGNNVLLGKISVPVPPAPKGQEAIELVYTYDVNSLLEVEVTVLSSGVKRKIIVQNEEHKISEEEAEERMKKLEYLKQNPRDEEATKLQLLRGERLYEEASGELRERIDRAMMDFERVLERQDRREIEKARETLAHFLDTIEYDIV
ncbi:MAG: molecular chaperone HscC [Firmicutes bacterium]|nr:molecular chaperone HscC [Bacillota bacterium]